MTNRPNESARKDDVLRELDELLESRPEDAPEPVEPAEPPEKKQDLSPEDLKLAAGHRAHRDSIALPADTAPSVLFNAKTRHRKRKKRLPTAAKIALGVLAVLLALILIAVAAYFILYYQGRGEMMDTPELLLTLPDVLVESNTAVQSEDGRTVTYKGETYRFNENRTNILCLGMDKEDLGLDYGAVGTAGQADTIVVLSVDTATGQLDALTVSRDSMVDINLHAEDGSFYGVENKQICLAYAYGDGFHGSCENMVTSVSRLLYGVPINTYFTINLSAIPTLNDAVGGVEVTLLKDFRRSSGYWCSEGETITLYGEEADRYVRDRNTSELDSNNARMERQKQYIRNFFNQALAATAENLQVPLDLFNTVAGDSVTNLSPSKITFLATTLVQHHSEISFHTVPGTVTEGADGKAEYHVDDEALYELILKIFFVKV